MKMLKKLALVSAISMISAGAFAMEAMDDESMAAATGQDGITIKVGLGTRTEAQLNALGVDSTAVGNSFDQIDVTDPTGAGAADLKVKGLSITSINIHDDDGIANAKNSGAIVIGGGAAGAGAAAIAADSTVVFADNNSTDPIVIKIDTVGDIDGAGAGGAMLNVAIHTPKLAIKTGAIYVANSDAAAINLDADGGAVVRATDIDGTTIDNATKVKIANSMEIVMGAMDINIQLGNEIQTLGSSLGGESAANPNVMVRVDATIVGGLTIKNLQMDDSFNSPSFTSGTTGGGSFFASSLTMTNAGGGDLHAIVGVNMASDIDGVGADTDGGLVVTLGLLGGGTIGAGTGMDVTINDIRLGSATAADMGDVQMLGLNIDGTSLIISGH